MTTNTTVVGNLSRATVRTGGAQKALPASGAGESGGASGPRPAGTRDGFDDVRPMRVMFVGAGGILKGRHLPAVKELGHEVVAVVARNPETAKELATQAGATVYTDLATAITEQKPDAAIIALPPFKNGQEEKTLARAGVPFLREKPVGTGMASPQEVAKVVKDEGAQAAVGFHWRYLEAVRMAEEKLDGRKVKYARAFWFTTTPGADWWSQTEKSGGQVVEQASHLFDIVRYFMGNPESVDGASISLNEPTPERDVPEWCFANMQFADGSQARVEATHAMPGSYDRGVMLMGDGFVMEVRPFELKIMDTNDRDADGKVAPQVFKFDPTKVDYEANVRQLSSFFEWARKGGSAEDAGVQSDYADAVLTHELAVKTRESYEQGGTRMPVTAWK